MRLAISDYARKLSGQSGFSFIEILITLAVISVAFLPLMHMYSVCLEQTYVSGDMTTARYLAQEGMEKVKNSGFTEKQLVEMGDIWAPSLEDPPLVINGRKWRVKRRLIKGSDPLEVRIEVYQAVKGRETLEGPVLELVTLLEDLDWASAE